MSVAHRSFLQASMRRAIVARALPLAAAGIAFGGPYAARAHAYRAATFHLRLVKSEPAKGDSVSTAPAVIKLWFSEKPELAVTGITLKRADGKEIAVSAPRVDAADKNLVLADLKGMVEAGAATISWKTSSSDGHMIKGEIPFVVRSRAAGDAK